MSRSKSGGFGRAAVPSGASTGAHEAVGLRDGERSRYGGKGVLTAIRQYRGRNHRSHRRLRRDRTGHHRHILIDLDGTPEQGRLGANAILAVSLAIAKAAAETWAAAVSLCRRRVRPHAAGADDEHLNGGKHADNPIDIQEFMIQPVGAGTWPTRFRMGSEVFAALKKACTTPATTPMSATRAASRRT